MSKVCQVTGRSPKRGNSYAIRGIAKKKKGIGLNITGKTKRRFLPNLKKKRLWLVNEGRFVTIKLSMQGLRLVDKVGIDKVVKRMRAQGQKV
jgi:large subunit ribosomal protein L28